MNLLRGIMASSGGGVAPVPGYDVGSEYLVGTSGVWLAESDRVYSDEPATTLQTVDGGSVRAVKPADPAGLTNTSSSRDITEIPDWDLANKSLIMDGSSTRLSVGIQPNNSNMTLGVRFKGDASPATNQTLLGASQSVSRSWIGLTDGKIAAGVGNTGSTSFNTGVNLCDGTTWHTGFLTWENGGDNIIYLNGSEVLRGVKSGATGTYPMTLGGRVTSASGTADLFFSGEISHWFVSQSVLTASEILDVYNKWNP